MVLPNLNCELGWKRIGNASHTEGKALPLLAPSLVLIESRFAGLDNRFFLA
jgi:hypothetical protein